MTMNNYKSAIIAVPAKDPEMNSWSMVGSPSGARYFLPLACRGKNMAENGISRINVLAVPLYNPVNPNSFNTWKHQ